MTFETYARGWLERQAKYAPGTLAFYRRSLLSAQVCAAESFAPCGGRT